MAKEYKDLVVGVDIGTAKVMVVVAEVLAGGEVAKRHLKAEVASLREHLDEIDAAMRVQIREDEGRAAHTEVRGE